MLKNYDITARDLDEVLEFLYLAMNSGTIHPNNEENILLLHVVL